jgi:hypothetical protein
MVFHEPSHLGPGCRLPIGSVFAHVQLNDDGLEMVPAPLVRDVKEFGVVGTRKQLVDVHDDKGCRLRVANERISG